MNDVGHLNIHCAQSPDQYWMQQALNQAQLARESGEVPVGAVLVLDNQLIAAGHNQPIAECDPTAHAEIVVLRRAGKILNNYRLTSSFLYVTLEPCSMCISAMMHARIQRVIFGARDPQRGCVVSAAQPWTEFPGFNHHLDYQSDVMSDCCAQVLREFFVEKRKQK